MNDHTKTQTIKHEHLEEPFQILKEIKGGSFGNLVQHAIQQAALATVMCERAKAVGKVAITLEFRRIGDTHQVEMRHGIKVEKPLPRGRNIEDNTSETPLHVGFAGKLSQFPHESGDLFKNRRDE